MRERWKEDRNIGIIIYVVSLVFLLFYGLRLNTPVVLDETGTLSNSAFLAGYDWSNSNKIMGNYYYKYFQAVLYVPFLLLIKNPFIRYKAMMGLNAALMSLIPVIAYHILRRYLAVTRKYSLLMAFTVGTIPSAILYAQYVRPDMALNVISWLVLLALLVSHESVAEGKKKKLLICSVIVGFLSVAAYMSHTRGVVMIIAVFLVIYGMLLFRRTQIVNQPAYLISLVVFLGIDKAVAAYLRVKVWPYGTSHASVEAFDFQALTQIFTSSGFKSLVKLIVGWIFSAFTSTWGLVAIGCIVSILVILYAIQKKYDVTAQELIITGFGLLTFLGNAALGILFFFKPVHAFFSGLSNSRADRIVYGRYMANAYGIICLVALYTLLCKREWLKTKGKLAVLVLDGGVVAFFAWKVAGSMEGASLKSRNMLELCMFVHKNSYGGTSGTFKNISGSMIQMGIMGLVLLAVILILSWNSRIAAIVAAVVIAANVYDLDVCFRQFRHAIDVSVYPAAEQLYEAFADLEELDSEYRNVYIGKGLIPQRTQAQLMEYRFYSSKIPDALEVENMFLILREDETEIDVSEFSVYKRLEKKKKDYIIYVKGDALKTELEQLGCTLTLVQQLAAE